jgi:FkbM family methyltransferase
MKSWRLDWALTELANLASLEGLAKHSRVLSSPWRYWATLLLKLVPAVWPFPVELRLKAGGVVTVEEFMTLFIYKEIFVDGCYDVPLPTAPSLILDVGANTGLYMIRMKQLYPNCKIHGFEPMPSNYVQLRRNLRLSGLAGVETHPRGVGGTTRREKLFVHDKNLGGHSIYPSQTGSERHVEIELVGLRELLDGMGGERCSVLKLDCEGAELEIIKSIDEQMAQRIDNVVFEPTPSLYDVQDAVAHLTDVGYRVDDYKGLRWAHR